MDVIATSWGGLAVLACLVDDPSAGWEGVKTIHLVAPGIFPERNLQKLMFLGAFKDSLRGRGFLSGRLRTMLEPSDFSDNPDLCAWLAADFSRNTELSPAFWLVTARMRRLVRDAIMERRLQSRLRDAGIQLFLHLAQDDSIIDLPRTEALLNHAGAKIFRYPSRCHAIVMQYPGPCARAMESCLIDPGGEA